MNKLVGLFFLGLVLGCPLPTLAQDANLSLVTSPLPLNLTAVPGSTVSAQLKIKNGGNGEERLAVGLMKFEAFGDEGNPRLMDRGRGDDYFDWVEFSENEFNLAANEWKTITMTIRVPETAAYGYYYAVTFGRKDESKAEGPRSTTIIGASASLVLLEVRVPNAVKEMEVSEFVSEKKVYEFLPAKFRIKVKNTGNIHAAPRGNVFISQGNKKEVAVLNINEFGGNVLPGSNRVFEISWEDGFPYFGTKKVDDQKIEIDSQGNPKTELSWDEDKLSKFRIGKFQATMLLVYDDGQRDVPIESRISFWVVPWRVMGVLGLVTILMMVGTVVVIRLIIGGMKSKK